MLPYTLLTAEQMRRVDARAINRIGDALPLMERAGAEVFARLRFQLRAAKNPPKILILCGIGNNGGDGFVVAHHCLQQGFETHLCLIGHPDKMSDTAQRAFAKLPENCLHPLHMLDWNSYTHIVDAMLGTGLERDVSGEFAEAITFANSCKSWKISVDIPSGIATDSGKILGLAFQADETVTFFAAKPGHYLLPGKAYCGKLTVADIGILAKDSDPETLTLHLNHPSQWQAHLCNTHIDQHKYHRGHSLILGGEEAFSGAAKLAALAALRAGSGLVSIACSPCALRSYAPWATAVMTKPYADDAALDALIQHPKTTAIAYGMGAECHETTRKRCLSLLQSQKPCVLDADALSAFEGQWDRLHPLLHTQAILTPHAGEFRRLFGDLISAETNRLQQALQAAKLSGAVIVLKGHDTIIASATGQALINYTAPPHLATAGSGDVLAGIITGQLAQGNTAFNAAASGVWMHSQSANRYTQGMIADDLIDGLKVEAKSVNPANLAAMLP